MHTGDQIIDAVIRAAAIEGAIHHKDGTFTFIWASNASEQIEAALAENAPTCTWTYDDWHGYYDTACGDAFWLAEEFKFCPYCGGRISLASKEEGEE
jgi:hypothetical protein